MTSSLRDCHGPEVAGNASTSTPRELRRSLRARFMRALTFDRSILGPAARWLAAG